MRAPDIVVSDPADDLGAGVVKIENGVLFRSSSRIEPLELSMKPFCIGFLGAMKYQSMIVSFAPGSMALEVKLGAMVGHDHP
ncbi:hypothetical protein GCM10010987_62910 [Bradyrhizobium guangdongense]|uniref:Uncharacterized protein n=1 Tax=Bradyrhizobium guangdongense TaxID=1325090 RepID=A0AA87WEG4_9BRAD|nr:hypothetical protein GCM10010987_62910 [Bradyrhizobium guangdongense]